MKKNPLKSKTIDGILVVMLIAIMTLLGFGEEQIAKTYDSLGQGDQKSEEVKSLITLAAGGFAIYGRYKVKEKDDE